jgi:hypothetical protein
MRSALAVVRLMMRSKLCRLLHRDISGLCSAQNLVEEISGASVDVREIWPIGQKPACLDVLARNVTCRQLHAGRQDVDGNNSTQYERAADDIQGIGAAPETLERRRDFFGTPDCNREGIKAEFLGGRPSLTRFLDVHGIIPVEQNGNTLDIRHGLAEDFEPFACHLG